MKYVRPKKYMRERYKIDPEFRERIKKAVRIGERKRYKKGITWQQQHPKRQRLYYSGYEAGRKRVMKKILSMVCPECRRELEKNYSKIVWR